MQGFKRTLFGIITVSLGVTNCQCFSVFTAMVCNCSAFVSRFKNSRILAWCDVFGEEVQDASTPVAHLPHVHRVNIENKETNRSFQKRLFTQF